MVYVYKQNGKNSNRHSNGSTDGRWIIAGGLLIAASVLFTMFDIRVEGLTASFGMNGIDIFNATKDEQMKSALGSMLYLPLIGALSGAVMAGSAFMEMKGSKGLETKYINWISIAAMIIPVAFFILIYSKLDLLQTAMDLMGAEIKAYPGAGLLMQATGGFICYKATKTEE